MADVVATTLRAVLPDHTPSREEYRWAVLAAFLLLIESVTGPSGWDWSWVMVGFVTTAIAAGPGATSAIGQQWSTWFREIGVFGAFGPIRRPADGIGTGKLLWVAVTIPLVGLYGDRLRQTTDRTE